MVFLAFLSCGVVYAETPQNSPFEIKGDISLVYDDNVFAYSNRLRDTFRANLRPIFFQNQNVNSLGDLITKPSFELHFRPQRYPSTDISAGLSGSFYRQNATLNDRSYFIKIVQALGPKTDISVTYDELFLESIPDTFRTVGVDIERDFQIFEGNIFAEGTSEDRNYGVGLTTSIPSRYSETTLSYEFDQYVPMDRTLAFRSHQFRVEPIFPVTETITLNLYADIQEDQFTNTVRKDMTLGWGFILDYAISENVATELGFDRIRWDTDENIPNASYKKNIITITVLVSL